MPGVLAVFVGADIPYNPLPMAWPAGGSAGLQNNVNTPRVLATDDVKWTGEGVAAVVAETPEAQAFDALSEIDVDYEPLPTVVDAEKATQPGAPQLHENAPNNIVFDWTVGDKDGTDAAIDDAEVVVTPADRQPAPDPEPDGDARRHRLVQPGHRRVHDLDVEPDAAHPAAAAAAFVMGIPEHKVRCISPDVGGAFGTKIFCYADMALTHVREQGDRRAAGEVGREPARELPVARSTAATTSRTSRSPASATARSPASASRRTPISAAASRRSAPASRRRSTAASCAAATASRTSTAR